MNDIWSVIEPHLREPIVIVDAGAMDPTFKQGAPEYVPDFGTRYETIGFEPLEDECALLNKYLSKGCKFLPYALGDGTERVFHRCSYEPTSSIYPPDQELLGHFQKMRELHEVVKSWPVKTVRLDDLAEVSHVDYLKCDVQGAELDVFRGAERLLGDALVVEAEVEFVPLYKGQPLFAEVDVFLRGRGLVFHFFPALFGRAFKPMLMRGDGELAFRQQLWGDAVYVRDFTRLAELSPERLLKYAAIVHDVYQSYDLAHKALMEYDRRRGSGLAGAYFELVRAAGAGAGVMISRG